ncbi:Nucleosome assembly protein 1 [Psilocybe cubensis]|uniref:Nucleosome assembly protein n=2 Tax=Psilocybe cubensis TaxID=181762 RepID=A0A8H8CIS8_PSICU|nr:Nucleosome assembly protein 1 [Psilocybe cubensis]KAH9475768.1 Nucleosome assembly protein 1 [Psilocybe cubensis]
MSSTVPISGAANVTAPTPQNTPLNQAPIALGLSRPTVPDITEDNEGEAAEDEGPSLAGLEQHMLGMVQGKLADLLGKSSGYIESLPVEIKLNVEALKGVQVKQNELHNQYKKECLELEKKYLELQKPLYERRSAIIAGKAAATTEEIEAGEEASVKEDEDYAPLPKDVKPSPSGIPEFWLTALRNHVGLSDMITDRDADALKHLVDVRLEYLKEGDEAPKETLGKPGFKIIFEFEKNDYFTNEVLEKTYLYQEEVGYSGDFVYDRALGTNIKWKEDKDLTKEFEIKKQRNKNTNRTRLVRKARPTESFFNFFSPPVPPTEEAIENGDYEDDELQELEEKLEEDYQIGEDLKEKIIPRAIDYFTGKALEYEIMDDEDEDDYEDSEDGDDDDDENRYEDDSDSDNDVPGRRRAPQKGRGGAAGGDKVNPEECKNQ